jgi:hypothetical protein
MGGGIGGAAGVMGAAGERHFNMGYRVGGTIYMIRVTS